MKTVERTPRWNITLDEHTLRIYDTATRRTFKLYLADTFSTLRRDYLSMEEELSKTTPKTSVILNGCINYLAGNKDVFEYAEVNHQTSNILATGRWEDSSVKSLEGFMKLYANFVPGIGSLPPVEVRVDPKLSCPKVYYTHHPSKNVAMNMTRKEAQVFVKQIRQITALHGITDYGCYKVSYTSFKADISPGWLRIASNESGIRRAVSVNICGSRKHYRREIARFCDQLMAFYDAPIAGMALRRMKHRGQKIPRYIATMVMRCMWRLPVEDRATS
jgi:hypothetical protein